ncbi:MAG: CBS domain-containing protein [Bacteroidetes bacterium]|nr:CBS domain-containing protein [Bacteroidota bacterium]
MNLAKELINHMIPPLKLIDKANRAIIWMEELRTNQLPVVAEGKFKGFISEEIILESNQLDLPISEYPILGKECFVHDHQHFYEIIKLATDNKVELIGVIDQEDQYLGVITVKDTLNAFAQTSAVQSPGGILILSMPQIDYSLSEISRLIESDGAKILSSSLNNDLLDPSKIKLTLKINITEISRIVATLERFGYKIIAQYQDSPMASNEKERMDILLKYLDI